jgi:branched-chain amino acid transport system permease protein
MAGAAREAIPRRAVGRLSGLPTRRIIQWVLGIAVVVGAALGASKTLALNTFSASAWRDLVVFGVAQGAIYALIALGYSMVYGV